MERSTTRSTRGYLGAVLAAALMAPVMIGLVAAQGGDQFLDGIGETALVARSLFNAASVRQGGRGRGGAPAPVISTAAIPKESPLAARLERVPDIQAETTVGKLPRLPREIPAVYRDKAMGPTVRVIWPSPKDNSQVATPGTYTVTGKVPGTALEPKATVTVKPAGKAGPAPVQRWSPSRSAGSS